VPHVALALLGGLLGLWAIVIAMVIWARIDYWWFIKGRTRFRKWKLGRMKPVIVRRTQHPWGPRFSPSYWCVTRDSENECTAMYRGGNAWSPEIAYARWRYNPKFWSGSQPVLKWQKAS
jgi:hypothetical protein